MTIGQSGDSFPQSVDDQGNQGGEVTHLLGLLGAGVTGGILIALGDGPLRTMDLTKRVSGYAPRTVYRYVSKLVEIGAIEKEEEPGVPSKVVHRLTDPCGTELCELVEEYARIALQVLPDGTIVSHSWGSLTLLADLWDSGMYEALNGGSCSATELARADHDLSFHQVSRRINLFLNGGFLREASGGRGRRRYELTEDARRETALIVGLGCWRERHLVPPGKPGLTSAEVAELLRAALPFAVLPGHVGKCLKLGILSEDDRRREAEVVWAEVGGDGMLGDGAGPSDCPHGWGRGGVGDWTAALRHGAKGKVRVGGSDGSLIKECLQGMHEALWKRDESQPPASSPL